IPFSVTDAALVFEERGKVAGRAVLSDGWPDVTGVLAGGRFLGVETKSLDGRLRPSQIACHAALRASGALVIVPRSVEDFARLLSEAGIQHPAITQLLNKSRTQR